MTINTEWTGEFEHHDFFKILDIETNEQKYMTLLTLSLLIYCLVKFKSVMMEYVDKV